MMLLGSGRASPSDLLACEQWRSSKAEHEHAWQRAQRQPALRPGAGHAGHGGAEPARRRAACGSRPWRWPRRPVRWPGPRGAIRWIGPPTIAAPPAALRSGAQRRIPSLNTASAVDVAFSAASRLLRLRAGEIALHVRDESGAQPRPFVVRALRRHRGARRPLLRATGRRVLPRQRAGGRAARGGARGTVSAAGGGRRAAPGRSGPIRRRARRSPCRRLDAQRAARP